MDNHQHNAEHDAVFVRNFALVLVGLTVIGIVIAILARSVYGNFLTSTHVYEGDVDSRITPVGSANTSGNAVAVANPGGAQATPTVAATPTAPASGPGEATYNKVCFACHAQGIAGAPKFKDAALWSPRIAKGIETLHKHAIEGFQGDAGIMPPKGGAADMSDDDVKAAVDFMVKAAQGGGDTPPAIAPAAAPAMAPASAPTATATAPPTTDANAATPAVAADDKGKQVFDSVCFACHTPGAAGAPKFGDAAAWAPRIAKGMDTLYEHAVNGFMGEAGMMPPKGGRPDFADADIKSAVDYMTSHSK